MLDQVYLRGLYTELERSNIRQRLVQEGWTPCVIDEPPGYTDAPHHHEEGSSLSCQKGAMGITFESETVRCLPDVKPTIPGGTEHAAEMGADGCVYFWSEQIRG